MAVVVYSASPETLLATIRKAIDDKQIETWAYDKDGDFTHTAKQWQNLAWLRPYPASGVLQLGLLGQQNVIMTKVVYAIYHGRFIEMLLTHCDGQFSSATATALAVSAVDNFKHGA